MLWRVGEKLRATGLLAILLGDLLFKKLFVIEESVARASFLETSIVVLQSGVLRLDLMSIASLRNLSQRCR